MVGVVRTIISAFGEALALLSIAVLIGIALWIPYLSAAPSAYETQYEVRK